MVLNSSLRHHEAIIKADTVSNELGQRCMWVLDFHLYRDMPMNEAGVKEDATAF